VKLVEQWHAIERRLPVDWVDVRLDVTPETESERPRAAGLLGPANPHRIGDSFRLHVRRTGGAGSVGPEGLRRLFTRMTSARLVRAVARGRRRGTRDRARGGGRPGRPLDGRGRLAATGLERRARGAAAGVERLPPRAALLCAPLNPTRTEGSNFRFRVARRAGYGASPQMVTRCLARLDAEQIQGDLAILRVLCETSHVATQGPVFRVGGRSV
jgi:hypothetical protein